MARPIKHKTPEDLLNAHRRAQREWYARNKLGERERQRRKWGLPQPTRDNPGICECCGKKPKGQMHLDHCHESGKFRGWLCATCNLAAGNLGDTIEGARNLVSYLERAYV